MGECGNDVGGCGNDVGECGNDVGECGNDVGECGNDVGGCGNDVGECGNDGESNPTCCCPGAIHAAKVNGTCSSQNLTAQNFCTTIDL